MPLSDMSIAGLHTAYADGLAVDEVIESVFARIETVADPGIFITPVRQEVALAAAAQLGSFDPVGKPLWGIPFAVKDNIDVAGYPTTAACPEFGYTPDRDSTVVARLKAAGGIFIGKTNLDQFATGLVGVRSPYPVPRNVVDPQLVPGGSSSGSAVATAQKIVTFALGTDTAGSGRVPAAMNDIVGLKPSLGAISTTGVVPACRTLDCVSVFAANPVDAWRAYEACVAHDADDPYSRTRNATERRKSATGCRIGIPDAGSIRFFGDHTQKEAFETAVDSLVSRGFEVQPIDFSTLYAIAAMLYEGAWVAERLAAISGFMEEHEDALHAVTARIIGGARGLSAEDAFNGFYRLETLKRQAESLLAGVDMLAVPTIPTFYTLADLEDDPIGPNSNLGTYTNFVNLLDMCALALPSGSRSDGLPFSITLLGHGGDDRLLMDVADILDGRAADEPERNEVDLVVVGAHLTGMPLNQELVSLGARLVNTTRTEPEYRLYALPGTVPAKPGMLRVGAESGRSIEVEVWTLSASAFASFVSAIPSPLGIGQVRLADGSQRQGFLVEQIAVGGALDVSNHGGWRNYIQSLAPDTA